MNLSLNGKYAVVCGSSQGIGLAVAQELALLGATCILLARDEDTLKEALTQLVTSADQKHNYKIADFTNPEEVRSAINSIVTEQAVDILVNNTGGPAMGPIVSAQEEEFLTAFQQHLISNHILTTAVIPGMKQANYGRIINIISTSVRIPLPNLGVSNTTRAAVAAWAKTMANELGEFNITVNNVLPGFTETQRLEALIDNAVHKNIDSENLVYDMKRSVPMRRFGDPAEIAAMAAFLATPAASYVNGASIPVDGGRTGSI